MQAGRRQAICEMQLQPEQRVLAIGVGTGLTLPLYSPAQTILGIDYSPLMLAQAQRRLARMGHPPHVRLMRADAAQLPFEDASFDVVYAPYVISVVPDPVKVGLELRRVCRPDASSCSVTSRTNRHRPGSSGCWRPWLRHSVSRVTYCCRPCWQAAACGHYRFRPSTCHQYGNWWPARRGSGGPSPSVPLRLVLLVSLAIAASGCDERGHCYARDTRSWQLPRAAGCGVSAPADRAECGVSSGAAVFGDVAGAAERGLVWTRRWLGAASGVVCQFRIVGNVHSPLVTRITTLRTPNKSGL